MTKPQFASKGTGIGLKVCCFKNDFKRGTDRNNRDTVEQRHIWAVLCPGPGSR